MTAKNTPLNSAAQPASSKGMPAKEPREQRARPEQAESPKDSAVEASLELPHDRDQSVDMTNAKPNPVVEQAGKDVERGVKDTSKSVEMDRAYKKL
ncbi:MULTISPECIES: hypothetical protein [unclassified Polaromonas]|jgi:hypothetical protein|uniref:hypothetical protein n=1 Tax=unclassified Polaromonas TaxID=2638319 RepID=UPI000F07F324|nr:MULTISPECIES: hypothetical protein [unclassified Polaromonas]AYQ30400.1 hypothetical protein DT070_06285 [Polaromonas sp. SP1]QGJ17480.1 hypothetical protein F7R28_03140 [Polaromonas sp. Pch-P]